MIKKIVIDKFKGINHLEITPRETLMFLSEKIILENYHF